MSNNYDVIIIGGGATGLGCALEAASRGYKTLVLEAYDYGKGTSAKSTKLVHGGIRYLANLDFALVQEGLEERYYFLKNAPHLAREQSYLIPMQSLSDKIKYWLGIKLYDLLAKKLRLKPSRMLSKAETLREAQDLAAAKINGGAIYYDGQFDDTRLLISLVKTIEHLGGVARNYHQVTAFSYDSDGLINGVTVKNQLSGQSEQFYAKAVINATGTFSDQLMNLAEPTANYKTVTAAQGTHLVFDKQVFNSKHAILVPKTSDGRVLFILPWLNNRIIVGTTDIQVANPSLEPQAQEAEIEFILATLNEYCQRPVTRSDIKAVFCGQRPLVKPASAKNSAKISRKHEILTTTNGLITIVGGKWTIYRRMGEDTINFLERAKAWTPTQSVTRDLALSDACHSDETYPLSNYGSAAMHIKQLQVSSNNFERLHPDLPYYQAEVIYQVAHEQARTVEDVLLRRTRALFLDAKAALAAAPVVAQLMASQLGYDQTWQQTQIQQFTQVAQHYLP